MDMKLHGKSVLITGASKGIGLACAESFAREGAKVVIIGRDDARLASAVEHLKGAVPGADVATFTGDLAIGADREKLFAAYPAIDILVNNAGAIPGGGLFDIKLDRWLEVWQLKVFGYIHLTQLYLEAMRERKHGVIVNIIGMAGQEPRWDYVCGGMGNAALIAMTRAVGGKSTDWGVRVFGINPTGTRTDRIETLLRAKAKANSGDSENWQDGLSALPFGRLTEASEIADLAVMLASPKASYLSGTVIDADGGQAYKG